ncbi:MAG: ferritin family protein [Candidatus Omnitrophota bacterium]
MGDMFSGSEIVEMAVQIEMNGKDFYFALTKKAKDPKAAKIFQFLADEEERHIATFRKIRGSVKDYEPKEAYPEEYYSYLRALAGDHIFTRENKGIQAAQGITSDKEALETGMSFEKDSIIFYEAMKKIVPETDRGAIEALIEQEGKHFTVLSELRNSLNQGG